MDMKVKVWVMFGSGTKFGEGRAELLRLVEEERSLRSAVARMGMSYRAAWGYLQELEKASGMRLLEPAGSGRSAGTRLTPEGRAFLAAFRAFRDRTEQAAGSAFAAAFRAGGKGSRARASASSRAGATAASRGRGSAVRRRAGGG
jgi:molybdate transport system regulatory protein